MKKNYSVLVLSAIAMSLLITGCLPKKIETVRPETVYKAPEQKAQRAPGSIWRGESDKSMIFTDKKAMYVDDIVTILVAEAAQGGNKATTSTSRDTANDASITGLLGIENAIINSNFSTMGGKIGVGGSSTNSLKGTGDTSRNNTLIAKISARVIRVMDNGNLLIEGRRQVTVNEEDQFLIISGIIRPQDVTTENTVASQYIADARIVYTGEGVINDKMRPGWLTRVVDWVWPF